MSREGEMRKEEGWTYKVSTKFGNVLLKQSINLEHENVMSRESRSKQIINAKRVENLNKGPECVLLMHVHLKEQETSDEGHSLCITDLVVEKGISFENVKERFLSGSILFFELWDVWKCSVNIFENLVIVATIFFLCQFLIETGIFVANFL